MSAKRPRPGMNFRWSKKPKPCVGSYRTVWVTARTPPFREDYMIGSNISIYDQLGPSYRCKRRKDARILSVQCIEKSKLYRLDRSIARKRALLMAMQGEIDIMRRLKHQYIVNMTDCYEDKHCLYVVSDECRGYTLFDRMVQKGRYTEKEAMPIIRMILEPLFYMHEYHRVVHCDLRPNKILFVDKTETSSIQIIGFGMSKVVPRLRALRPIWKTSYYISPEVMKGDYAHCCDIWSLGVIMFLMLYGYPPFYINNNQYFGQKQNEEICKLISNGAGYKDEIFHDCSTELIIYGYIREQQQLLDELYGNVTFYIISPLIIQQILLFSNQCLSNEAYDLMTKLLEYDVLKRLTAKEALLHPWFPKQNENNTVNIRHIGRKQLGFIASSLFRRTASELFASNFTTLTVVHFETLKNIWRQMDTNNNGTINIEQFKKGILELDAFHLNDKEFAERFHLLEERNVGKICFEALLSEMFRDYCIATDQRLYAAFVDLDDDEDGRIRTEHLKSKIKQLDVYGKAHEILEMVDPLDNDGCIDYEEFLYVLHKDFNKSLKIHI